LPRGIILRLLCNVVTKDSDGYAKLEAMLSSQFASDEGLIRLRLLESVHLSIPRIDWVPWMSANGNIAMPELKSNWRRGFWSLIATQFQGAFNENALKFLTIYLILALVKDNAQRDRLEFLVGVLFALRSFFSRLVAATSPTVLASAASRCGRKSSR